MNYRKHAQRARWRTRQVVWTYATGRGAFAFTVDFVRGYYPPPGPAHVRIARVDHATRTIFMA